MIAYLLFGVFLIFQGKKTAFIYDRSNLVSKSDLS